jgi:hypothetical protein
MASRTLAEDVSTALADATDGSLADLLPVASCAAFNSFVFDIDFDLDFGFTAFWLLRILLFDACIAITLPILSVVGWSDCLITSSDS